MEQKKQKSLPQYQSTSSKIQFIDKSWWFNKKLFCYHLKGGDWWLPELWKGSGCSDWGIKVSLKSKGRFKRTTGSATGWSPAQDHLNQEVCPHTQVRIWTHFDYFSFTVSFGFHHRTGRFWWMFRYCAGQPVCEALSSSHLSTVCTARMPARRCSCVKPCWRSQSWTLLWGLEMCLVSLSSTTVSKATSNWWLSSFSRFFNRSDYTNHINVGL